MRLQFVGPMTGLANTGHAPTQGETLAQMLSTRGYHVELVSRHPNRYARLADIVFTTLRHSARVDIQMLQVFSGPSFLVEDIASRAGALTRTPIVMTLHGGGMPQFARRFPKWTRRVLGRAAALVAPSDYLAHALQWLGLPIRIIPNILESDAYNFQLRRRLRPRLFWMRAFHEIYNPDMAVRVLARLVPFVPDISLTMAGPDLGHRARTELLAQMLGVRDRIEFTGLLDAGGKARAGAEHDIYLNTNLIDNMPVSVLELAAMGVPVVSTSVGGIPYLLTHEMDGLLVPGMDDLAMAKAVRRLLRESELTETLSRNGRALAAKSALDQVAPKWERLFAEIAPA